MNHELHDNRSNGEKQKNEEEAGESDSVLKKRIALIAIAFKRRTGKESIS